MEVVLGSCAGTELDPVRAHELKFIFRARDEQLLDSAKRSVEYETEATLVLLHHLREVELHGRRCNSDYLVQHDHIIPVAKSGLTTVENLRLLCRARNRRAAIEVFGHPKIAQYVRSMQI